MKHVALVLLLATVFLASGAYADVNYIASSYWTGVRDVEVAGNFAFSVFENGLVVLNIANPGKI